MILPTSLTIIYDVFAMFVTKAILKTIELISIFIFFFKSRKETAPVQTNDALVEEEAETEANASVEAEEKSA